LRAAIGSARYALCDKVHNRFCFCSLRAWGRNANRIIALLLALSPYLLAQQPLSFEVASVKLRPTGTLIVAVGASPSGNKLTVEAMSRCDLISWAYDRTPWEVKGGPAWAGTGIRKDRSTLDTATSRFDIVAKAEGDAHRSSEEFREMLRSLLRDRFRLKNASRNQRYLCVCPRQRQERSEIPRKRRRRERHPADERP